MSGLTPRFALSFFDDETSGSLSDDSGKHTGEDRLTIDRLLGALETHTHRVNTITAEPTEAPLLADGSTGSLSAGQTYYYVTSFVNADGLETAAGPEESIDLPDLLATPDAPQGETSNGSGLLGLGQYYYALSGLRGSEETPLSEPAIVTLVADEDTVTLTLPALGDATTVQVWRQKSTESGWTRIGLSATGTYVDDGSVPAGAYGDPDNSPPLTNTGISNYSITVTLTAADQLLAVTANSWRIYRSTESGAYSAASLVHDVVERLDDDDPLSALRTSWIDDGDAPLTGSPKLFSQELVVPPFTFQFAATLPDPAGYPDYYPIVDADGIVYIKRSGVWTPVGSQRGVAVFTGTGAPTLMPTGALTGDLYIDLSNGDLYTL